MQTISIGFSPCPNDTFIFDALINNKIDTRGIRFNAVLEDVQTLNEWAMEGKLPVTKLSYGVLPLVADRYKLLNAGSALGRGVGPLLISLKNEVYLPGRVNNSCIAIPGENTTAHLLFSLAYPGAKNKIFLRYDEIEQFVSDGNGLGVIIHENRFTYKEKGLEKITDLGDFWENQTGQPIPLGGIVVSNLMNYPLQKEIDVLIKTSINYAFSNYPELNDYIRSNAQEMSDDVMRKHIDLYVNPFSIDLGEEGKKAVLMLMEVYRTLHPSSAFSPEGLFVDDRA